MMYVGNYSQNYNDITTFKAIKNKLFLSINPKSKILMYLSVNKKN